MCPSQCGGHGQGKSEAEWRWASEEGLLSIPALIPGVAAPTSYDGRILPSANAKEVHGEKHQHRAYQSQHTVTSSKHVNVHAFGDIISCCTLDSSGSLVLREGGTSNKVKSESKMGREAPASQTLDSSRAFRLRLHISTGQGGSKVPTRPGCGQNNSVRTSGVKQKCQ